MIDEKQFIRFFVRYETELRGFAMTLMPCSADAEDVLQEACVAMWSRIKDLEDEDSFRPWAYTFVRFTALNRIRKRNRSPLFFSEETVELLAAEGAADAERADAELHALTQCLEKLPAAQMDLIRRYYASAKVCMADVAEVLHKNTAGLYKALERSRDALRVCIERRMTDEGY